MGTKNVPLSEVQRAQIVVRHKEGYSERAISQKIKKSKNAVHNTIVKFRNTGTYSTTQKSGRPPGNTPRDDQAIRRIAVRSPTSSFSSCQAGVRKCLSIKARNKLQHSLLTYSLVLY